jgi:PncC family amidohydrolase
METPVPSMAELVALSSTVGKALAERGLTCALAESCTGGLVGHLFTEVSGSSAYFAGSAVVYSYAAKEAVVAVDHQLLVTHGAVSAEVARQMAQGALRLFDADVAASVTGVAGPDGGTAEKPVGTVHIHVSGRDGSQNSRRFVWKADRTGNKLLSAQAALDMILAIAQDFGEASKKSTSCP